MFDMKRVEISLKTDSAGMNLWEVSSYGNRVAIYVAIHPLDVAIEG